MYSTRLNSKRDENDRRTDVRQIEEKNAISVQKNVALPELKRPAFGEVKNLKTGAVTKKSSNQPQKPSNSMFMFKDVKSIVDSLWRKLEFPTANMNQNVKAAPMLVTMKEAQLVKPDVPKKVTLAEGMRSALHGTVAQHVNNSLRRSESLCVASNNIGMVLLPSDVVDIDDDEDSSNLFLASDYVKDIYAYLFQLERKFAIRENHLNGQKQVTKEMRTTLIDWINETHLQFSLLIDTYFMTVAIIDRFLQAVKTTTLRTFQLVGVSAMFMASKYEEMYPPSIKDFVYITDSMYSSEQIITMEQFIFKNLGFNLSPPLVIHFARRFAKAAIRKNNNYDHTMSKYFIELASIEYSLAHHLPSAIAAAAVFMSTKLTLTPNKSNDDIWTATLQYYTTHTLDDLMPIVRTIAKIAVHAPQAKEKSVYQKYSIEKYEKVALRSVIYGPVMEGMLSF